jgi:biopolymer transport protein ExbD
MVPLQRKKRRTLTQPEITLTPLIDTALTLLIIFMVTTPMIQNSIKIDLPKGQAQEGGKEPQELVVTIDKKETIYCNNKPVTIETLGQEIKNCLGTMSNKEGKRVWVKVDRQSCSADSLISVIDCIKVVGGVKDVAIATERPSGAKAT